MFDPYPSRRSPVFSRRGIAATSQPLASAAGVEILSRGGNAADASVACAAVLNVTEPTSTGIGGDCFSLYYDAAHSSISALNGSGRAPAALTIDRLQKEDIDGELPPFHPYTITVPGACAGWCDLIEKHGTLPLSEILAPAIRLAENGFPVAPITSYFWQRGAEKQLKTAPNGFELTIDGRAPAAGEVFRNPGLVNTLNLVAEQGKQVFYQGPIAQAIEHVVQNAGGCLTQEDLAAHQSTWEEPINIDYKGYRIWECPPNGQGLTALIALKILESFDLGNLEPLSSQRLHIEIEAMRLAFADARRYISDPGFFKVPVKDLLSEDYAKERRLLIDEDAASGKITHGGPFASSDTVYLCVVDEDGNACSFINSNYMGFGTGIVPTGFGFSLQNRGHNFSLEPGHPNALAPGKRPYHTIIPGMITRSNNPENVSSVAAGELYAAFGVMGGFMQPQGHMQVVTGLVDDNLDPQSALDRPRFCIMDGEAGGTVSLESGISLRTMAELAQKGHAVAPVDGHNRALFGRGQIICRSYESSVLVAGSDSRADGCAMTY